MLPTDILNLITDYYVSMTMYEIKQGLNQQIKSIRMIQHLKAFHSTTTNDGVFCPYFCLTVINYMKTDPL